MPAPVTHIDPALFEFCTVRQLEVLEAVEKHGSFRAAARALGVNYSAVPQALSLVQNKAAAARTGRRYPVPEGHLAAGVTQYYDPDGAPKQAWVKSKLDATKYEELTRRLFDSMAEDLPRLKPTKAPAAAANPHLATLYTLTDSHVGMMAWAKEGGADWNLDIAEKTLIGCFQHMVSAAPPSAVGIVNQLGDFLHQDGLAAVTPTSGHNLDSDGRFPKIVETAIRVLRTVVALALNKHAKVVVLLAEGNHDIVSSIWLRAMFKALYEREPRVEVLESELPYYAYQHGKTLLAFHHGHMRKFEQLPGVIAAQFPKLWGNTSKRYCHTGHMHHVRTQEFNGITVVQHPTLAARDAYASRHGWVAERQVTAMTYHDEFGCVHSDTVVPEMIAA